MQPRARHDLEHTPTGEALREDIAHFERRVRGMGTPHSREACERKALYAALARRAREAYGRLRELEAQLSIRDARRGLRDEH